MILTPLPICLATDALVRSQQDEFQRELDRARRYYDTGVTEPLVLRAQLEAECHGAPGRANVEVNLPVVASTLARPSICATTATRATGTPTKAVATVSPEPSLHLLCRDIAAAKDRRSGPTTKPLFVRKQGGEARSARRLQDKA